LDSDDDVTFSPQSPAPPTAYVPPRPPNPEMLRLHSQVHEKIRTELASLSSALALDAERLRAQQSDLLAAEPAIRDEMGRLEAVRDICRNVAGRSRVVVDAAQRNVEELRRKGEPEVDELVCATTIVHNQLRVVFIRCGGQLAHFVWIGLSILLQRIMRLRIRFIIYIERYLQVVLI